MRTQRPLHVLAGTALLLAAAAGAAWQFGLVGQSGAPGGAGAPLGAMPPAPVEVSEVATGEIVRVATAIGTLRSDETLVVRPEIAGRIATIHFAEGTAVAKGAPIVSLDDAVARAELDQDRAKLKLAEVNHGRASELMQRGAGTVKARDEALSTLEIARATVALDEAKLAKTVIRAPFSGVLGLRRVTVGDYVNPGQDLVNLESMGAMKVDFRVPEIHLAQVEVGRPIEVEIEALGGLRVAGKVYAIDPLVDQGGRSVVVRARLPNAKGRLRPGVFGRVELVLETRRDALLIPEAAIVPVGDKQFVYVVADGMAVRREVRTGLRRDGQVEIRDGVSRGDKVVTAGQLRVRDGAPVAIAGAKP